MDLEKLSLILALGATLSFATSSLIYAEYSKRVSVLWMNCFKSLIAFIALTLTIPIFTDGWHHAKLTAIGGLMLSGLIGLNIGDLFLLSAFTRLGVARTLILFGFQPLFVGIAAFYLFDQPLDSSRFIAVIFLIACLFTFSLERYRAARRWELKGLFYALMGVLLDTVGVLLTRASFTASPEISPMEGHFYRCLGALIGFAVISFTFRKVQLFQNFNQWTPRVRTLLIAASLGGTYFSLILYLSAVKIGHLASISSIAITGPMFATTLECLVHRKAPSKYLIAAFVFFCIGFSILLHAA
jgi:drug/metabolite transporter (DMT)-like permease